MRSTFGAVNENVVYDRRGRSSTDVDSFWFTRRRQFLLGLFSSSLLAHHLHFHLEARVGISSLIIELNPNAWVVFYM